MHRVVILAYDGVQSLDVCGPAEVFQGANDARNARDATIGRNLDIRCAHEDPDLQISQTQRALAVVEADPLQAHPQSHPRPRPHPRPRHEDIA